MTEDEKDDWHSVQFRIEDEGIHYCFDGYSKWERIKDEEFHKLRKAYLNAAEELKNYVLKKNEEADKE